jgi:hypothetical protein
MGADPEEKVRGPKLPELKLLQWSDHPQEWLQMAVGRMSIGERIARLRL